MYSSSRSLLSRGYTNSYNWKTDSTPQPSASDPSPDRGDTNSRSNSDTQRSLAVDHAVQSLKAQLQQEEARCSQLLQRCTQAEQDKILAEKARESAQNQHADELSVLRAALDESERQIRGLTEARIKVENEAERRERQLTAGNGVQRGVAHELEAERLAQELRRVEGDNRALRECAKEMSELVTTEQEELLSVTERRDKLEQLLSDAEQQLRLERGHMEAERQRNTASLAAAEEKVQVCESRLQQQEEYVQRVTTDSVKMKAALAASIKHAEKNAVLHACKVQELERDLEQARHTCDSEVKRLEVRVKELQLSLSNAARENGALVALLAEQQADPSCGEEAAPEAAE